MLVIDDDHALLKALRASLAVRDYSVVTASTVPGEPTAAYRTLFLFYAAMLVVALVAYLSAKDAKPAAIRG